MTLNFQRAGAQLRVLVALSLAIPACTGDADRGSDVYTIAVHGMGCEATCPPMVVRVLGSVPGVIDVRVDFEAGLATVTTAHGQVEPQALIRALERESHCTGTLRSSRVAPSSCATGTCPLSGGAERSPVPSRGP